MATMYTKVDRPLSAAEMAEAILRPHRRTGARVPTYPECIPTATTQFRNDVDVTCGGGTSSETNGWGLLTRSPVYPFWFSQSIADKWTYQAVYETGAKFGPIPVASDAETAGDVQDLLGSYSGNTGGSQNAIGVVDGAALPAMTGLPRATAILAYSEVNDKPDIPFVFVPKGARATVVLALTGSAMTAGSLGTGTDVNLEYMLRGMEQDEFSSGALVTSSNFAYKSFVATKGLWVRPVSATATLAAAVIAGATILRVGILVTNTSAGTVSSNVNSFPAFTLTNASVDLTPKLLPYPGTVGQGIFTFSNKAFESCMTTGVSLLMENVSKVMNKEGTITAGCLTDGSENVWSQVNDNTSTLSAIAALPPQRRYRGASEHGLTMSVLPGKNFQTLRSHTVSLSGFTSLNCPVMSFRPGDYFSIFAISDADVETPMTFSTTVSVAWEYVTDTQFVESSIAGTPLEVMHKAMLQISAQPFARVLERGTVLAVAGASRGPAAKPKPKPKPKPQMIGPKTKAATQRADRRRAQRQAKRMQAKK